jgi:hypothetical protein
MFDMEDTRPYIRPCAAIPDGMFLHSWAVDRLLERGWIESAFGWAENATPNDYAAIYFDEDMDVVVRELSLYEDNSDVD